MRVMSLSIRVLLLTVAVLVAVIAMSMKIDDSPHGEELKISCSVCHSPKGWELDYEIYSFDHNTTNLPLEGQHTVVNCKLCHPSLVFKDAGTECASCHTDMHYQTVGPDCARCHTPQSWIVNNITEIHQMGRFPLVGPHLLAECEDCHPSASLLRFEPLKVECIDCHQEDYASAMNPNHVLGNISTDCIECHSMTAYSWTGAGFNHSFFPLTDGHEVDDCSRCHTGNDYSNISSECVSCHQSEYNSTSNPNHVTANIPTDCMLCHSTLPGWTPAVYPQHDEVFPLTNSHAINDCASCHIDNDYINTSAECFSCHQPEFNASTNPNHVSANIPTDCILCHSTQPGWTPAIYPQHDEVFPLTNSHAINDCASCHIDNNYINTSAECVSCHLSDYNNTTNPDHVSAGLSTDCMECHSTLPDWKPAAFPVHDAQFFPINSGKHQGEWNTCADCHTNPASWAVFSCIDCHEHNRNDMDDKHSEMLGYQYTSTACLDCHPTGSKE